jgi:transposase
MGIATAEVRARAIAAYKTGNYTQADIAKAYGVNIVTFQRWLQRYRETGRASPLPRGHNPAAVDEEQMVRLKALVKETPDATLEELREQLGVTCSIVAIHNALQRADYRFKKTLKASEQERPDINEKRERWMAMQRSLDLRRLVFVDESGAKTNMTRLRGRALHGVRLLDHAPHGHWCTTTLISSIRLDGTSACLAVDGPTDTDVFREYVRCVLVPSLRPGDIVILDNLAAHSDAETQKLIEATQAQMIFLPPYSPDLNPIEKMWSKVKSFLRKAKARTKEALHDAVAAALKTITSEDAQGWFISCGYTASQS